MTLPSRYVVADIETNGLNPVYGDRITCICARDNLGNAFSEVGEDELQLIQRFLAWLNPRSSHTLVTANGRDFDVPFIFARAVLLGVSTAEIAFLLSMEHFDLQHITKRKISLNDLATLFLGEQKSGNGFEAIRLFEQRRLDELKGYCIGDVLLTERVFLAYGKLREARS